MVTPRAHPLLATTAAALLLAACAPEDLEDLEASLPEAEEQSAAPAGDTDLAEQISDLEVAPEEQESSYEREMFGDYDRDQALADNQNDYPTCEGYYSRYDDVCHASADDVDIDEVVARAEAWRSGAHAWDDTTLDQFGGDPANLVVMTSSVNQHEKSDNGPTAWTPQARECEYVEQWVTVKLDYELTADQDEAEELEDMAANC